jgi:hypothetical protein
MTTSVLADKLFRKLGQQSADSRAHEGKPSEGGQLWKNVIRDLYSPLITATEAA